MYYFYCRAILRWFCKMTKQQCSGKQKYDHATEWCQLRALHDGVCVAYNGREFIHTEEKVW